MPRHSGFLLHMGLAVHIRQPGQLNELDQIPDRVLDLYDDLEPEACDWVRSIPEQVDRVYVGDEFCVHRMPEPDVLKGVMRWADTKGWPVTLLTPPSTDEGLEICSRLFRLLEGEVPVERVVRHAGLVQPPGPGLRLVARVGLPPRLRPRPRGPR